MMKILLSVTVILASINHVCGTTTVTDLQLLIYETDDQFISILEEQAEQIPDITTFIVGHGEIYEGFGSKYESIIPVLQQIDVDALVVLSDSCDVLLNHPWNTEEDVAASTTGHDFIEAFNALTSQHPGAIVASAESQCCVGALTYAQPGDYFDENGRRKGRACSSGRSPCLWNGDDKVIPWQNFMKDLAFSKVDGGDDIFLNAGLIAGRAGDMLRLFVTADFEVHEDDQAVLTDYMYRRPNEIILDYNQVLFGNNRHHETNGCIFQDQNSDKRLTNKETKATPLFIHSPGGHYTCHESLATRLGVDLHSTFEERLLLEDWKRDLQNYPPVRTPTRADTPVSQPVAPPVPVPVVPVKPHVKPPVKTPTRKICRTVCARKRRKRLICKIQL